jgi:hypothetical protein
MPSPMYRVSRRGAVLGAGVALCGCSRLPGVASKARLAGVRIENRREDATKATIEVKRNGEQVLSATTELAPYTQAGSFGVFEADWSTTPAQYHVQIRTDGGLSLERTVPSGEDRKCVFLDVDIDIGRRAMGTPWPGAEAHLQSSVRSVEALPILKPHCNDGKTLSPETE